MRLTSPISSRAGTRQKLQRRRKHRVSLEDLRVLSRISLAIKRLRKQISSQYSSSSRRTWPKRMSPRRSPKKSATPLSSHLSTRKLLVLRLLKPRFKPLWLSPSRRSWLQRRISTFLRRHSQPRRKVTSTQLSSSVLTESESRHPSRKQRTTWRLRVTWESWWQAATISDREPSSNCRPMHLALNFHSTRRATRMTLRSLPKKLYKMPKTRSMMLSSSTQLVECRVTRLWWELLRS